MNTDIQETELYKKFKKALNIQHDMRPGANPFVVACCEIAESYHKQKLSIASIGSKRLLSIKWKADQAKQHLDNMLEDIEHIQAACASGGEGKGVSVGCTCGSEYVDVSEGRSECPECGFPV